MTEALLKIEADEKGIWISALSDEISQASVKNFLRANGVRKYDEKAVQEFVKQKLRSPFKIAGRDAAEEKEAVITVQLAKDNMTAAVSIEPPFFTKNWPTLSDLEETLQKKNVVHGIDKEALKKIVDLKIIEEPVIVAHGYAAQNGENAWVELLMDPDNVPQADLNAQIIDHRNRSAFMNVLKGQEIAVKHPATLGTDGKTVIGSPVKAIPGKDASFGSGGGLEVSENGLLLTAAIDGRLSRKDGKLVILPELEVKGDVDFGTGNINFTGSVKIAGAVREGFHVFAAGNIEIKGTVEGAQVESLSDIIIGGGVRGMGKARIVAEGSISVGFVDQAVIQSNADIKVKDAVLHSTLSAQNAVIIMGGQKGQLAGGKVQAGMEVACQTLGSEMGTKTEVIVGVPPALAERRKEVSAQIAQHKNNLEKLEANLVFLKKQEQAGSLDDKKRAILMTATKTKFQLQSLLSSLNDEYKELEARLELGRAKGIVRVKEVCYPGVQISIRGAVYVVREVCKFSSFVYEDGEIKLRAYDHGI